MHRIDGPGHVDNQFSKGNPATGGNATEITPAFLNALQEELCTVIEAAGIVLSKPANNQLLAAILALGGGVAAGLIATADPPENPVIGQIWFPLPSANPDAPTVTAFTAGIVSGLGVAITVFSATDLVAVTGYLVTESSTPPTAGQAGWSAQAPTSYATGSAGTKTLYPWAKNAAGYISNVFGTPRQITFTNPSDVTAPVVTSFAVGVVAGLSVTVTTMTATDANGVIGYLITESATPPTAGQAGWSAQAPSSYATGSAGTKTLYPWAKDGSGNVSAVYGSPPQATFTAAETYDFTGANGATWDGTKFGANILYENAGGFGQALSAGSLVDIQTNQGRLRMGSTISGYGVGMARKYLPSQINFSSVKRTITWRMTGVLAAGENNYRGPAPSLILCSTDLVSGASGFYGHAQNEMRVVSVGYDDASTTIYMQCRVGGVTVYNQATSQINGTLGALMDFRLEIGPGSPCELKLYVNNNLMLSTSNIALASIQNLFLAASTGRAGDADAQFDSLVIA